MEKKQTSFVVKIDDAQRLKLESLLQEKGWDFAEAPYAHWKVSGPKINLVAYCSGKLTIQGGNAAEFVEFTLEPEILGALLNAGGGSTAPADVDRSPHGGIDESGKGDFFGPLAVACVFSGGEVAEQLAAAGVCDSKMISSDRKIYDLEKRNHELEFNVKITVSQLRAAELIQQAANFCNYTCYKRCNRRTIINWEKKHYSKPDWYDKKLRVLGEAILADEVLQGMRRELMARDNLKRGYTRGNHSKE